VQEERALIRHLELADALGVRARRRACAQQRELARIEALHRESHVLLDRQRGKQVGDLIGAADAERGASVRTQARDVATAEAHRAFRDGHFTRDRVEERRLAGAVGADDRPALAFANAERDAVDGPQRAEADGKAVEFEQLQDFLMPWNERLYDACFMYVSGSYFQN
ncbi:MAG TPA: hypothetical protein VFP36_03895, partial [Usitatibacter sp.]|nr:hypothetical protein [Usitatibacter sp.]